MSNRVVAGGAAAAPHTNLEFREEPFRRGGYFSCLRKKRIETISVAI